MGKTFISYLRVSTGRQGMSGLGLEAQRAAVDTYVRSVGGVIVAEHVEVESGKLRDRPVLVKSIAQCRSQKATLVIAKLDRLARNVAFVSSLMEAGVEFVAVDAPYANRLMLHILAAFAEHERGEISARTKSALAAARSRGVALGRHGSVLAAANRQKAQAFAESVRPAMEAALQACGHSLTGMAVHLNMGGVPTQEPGRWHPQTVSRVLGRLALAPAPPVRGQPAALAAA